MLNTHAHAVEAPARFQVRLATPADEPEILEVLAEYLPEEDPIARRRWLYDDNPHGRALTWLARDEATGALVGLTSFFPRRMILDGGAIHGALGGDGYVRPAARRRGIGRLLHQASRRDMSALGIDVMFGTPMPANLTPLAKAGARTITEVARYVRPLQAGILSRLGLRAPPRPSRLKTGTPRLEPMVVGDRRVDRIWDEARGDLRLATVRDAEFYTWRFLRSPTGSGRPFVVLDGGRPIGACALERVEKRLRLVDLVAPARQWGRVLEAIAAHGRGCHSVEIKLTLEDGRARWMWRHGFFARDRKPLNLLLPEGEPRGRVLYDPARWYFTCAESDMDHD